MRIFEIKKNKRLNIGVHMLLTFCCQFVLVLMTFHELFTNVLWAPYFLVQASTLILFGRFICCTILHLSLIDQVQSGLDIMKFSCNHHYKFHSPLIAFTAGLLLFGATVSVEIASIGVVCQATDTIDIIFNFIALAILTNFS